MRLYLEVSLDTIMFHSFILKPSLFVPLDIHNLVTCHLLEEMGPIPVTDAPRHGVGEHRCDMLCCCMGRGGSDHQQNAQTLNVHL